MTEISSLPVNQKDPQLEEILDSLWNEGQMSDDKYQSTLDGLFINVSAVSVNAYFIGCHFVRT
jgi:hypothetical protein